MGKLQEFVDNVNNFAEAVGDDIKSLKIKQENFINDQQSASNSTYSSEMINNRAKICLMKTLRRQRNKSLQAWKAQNSKEYIRV